MVASCKGIILPAKQAPYRWKDVHAGACFKPAVRDDPGPEMICVGALHKPRAQAWCKGHDSFRQLSAGVPNSAIGVPNLDRCTPCR